jgi:hypothetical protein
MRGANTLPDIIKISYKKTSYNTTLALATVVEVQSKYTTLLRTHGGTV